MKRAALLTAVGLALVLAPALSAQSPLFSYSVKFVCGYNPLNVGQALNPTSHFEGEPTVKFGNYATDINIYNPTFKDVQIRKSVLLLNRSGFPIGREPNFVFPSAFDFISLPPGTATMDDCNRIAELMFGNPVPTPLPLLIGFLVLQATEDIDVTAVYTSQACSYWSQSPFLLECLDPSGRPTSTSLSIDVDQVRGRRLQ